jgi:hypothetical protein
LYYDAQYVQSLDVYPGGTWESISMTQEACIEYPDSLCNAGGSWDPSEDDVESLQRISHPSTYVDDAYGINIPTGRRIQLGLTINKRTVWNASLASSSSGNITYPSGVVGGVVLGHLSLGAEDPSQFFTLSDKDATAGGIEAWTFPGKLYNDSETPSYSYGLHIGSAAFQYPGSLVFGGYNKGRLIGPVTSFEDPYAVDLIDIGVGVEFGASPFNFTETANLLSESQKVAPNPLSPYLSLPGETCKTIADLLPVRFDDSLKYYVWNTEDAQFAKVVSSPAYLSFTFPPAPGDVDNVVIKVPFTLLNLTLGPPIVDTPIQYFPCVRYDKTPVLGRAFLQAAFLGRNWNTKTSWLAQAPGPGDTKTGLGNQNTDIPDRATSIEAFTGSSLFNQSWRDHWSIIESSLKPGGETSDPPTPPPSKNPTGLSAGAKAGIGTGAGIGAIALLACLLFLWKKRSKDRAADLNGTAGSHIQLYNSTGKNYYASGNEQDEWVSNRVAVEIPDAAFNTLIAPVEVPDTSQSNMR